MSGAEHYQRAEELLNEIRMTVHPRNELKRPELLQLAQIHATLADVAVRAEAAGLSYEAKSVDDDY